ncbi:MAG: uracil-DNA glycosylase [Bacteroidota bacterium]|jgi:uracil-DNA glycosylase family 4
MNRSLNTLGLKILQKKVTQCGLCARLVRWRQKIAREKVARFKDSDYWGKPVPGFGDANARLLIVGLAPAAHGGNRTGRMFTGDRSGDWLYRALHKFGFANHPTSVSRNDGLKLKDCYITASARCAPPQNKLQLAELRQCRPYLLKEIQLLPNVRVIVALGKVGFDTVVDSFRELGMTQLKKRQSFGHGKEIRLNESQVLIASYHPSQQNTFTGKLTEPMFDDIFRRAREIVEKEDRNKRK